MQVCTSLQTDNHTSTHYSVFLQAGCPTCRPTNSVKALNAKMLAKYSYKQIPQQRRESVTLMPHHVNFQLTVCPCIVVTKAAFIRPNVCTYTHKFSQSTDAKYNYTVSCCQSTHVHNPFTLCYMMQRKETIQFAITFISCYCQPLT